MNKSEVLLRRENPSTEEGDSPDMVDQPPGATRESAPLKILLTDTTRYAEASRLAIAFSKAGCLVSAIRPRRGHPIDKTRGVAQSFPYHPLRPLEALANAITSAEPDLIVPCDDRGRQHLRELYAAAPRFANGHAIAALIEKSFGAPDSYPIVTSRLDLLGAARKESVRVAPSERVDTAADLKAFIAVHGLPVVLKADGTWGGVGVKIARTEQQALDALRLLQQPRSTKRILRQLAVKRDAFGLRSWWNPSQAPLIAQAFVGGVPGNCAVFCWQGKILAGISVEAVATQDETGPATVVRVIDSPEMMTAAARIASRLCLSGFFGLDFMLEARTDAAYLIEMNPRCTPLCHLQLGPGRDLIAATVEQLSAPTTTGAGAVQNDPAGAHPIAAQLAAQPNPIAASPAAETAASSISVTQNELIAYFPLAWIVPTRLRQESYQDIPEDAPDLVRELLHPWPERTLLSRVIQKCSDSARALTNKP